MIEHLYIGGEWRDSTTGKTFAVTNPATGDVHATLSATPTARICNAL